MDWIQELIEALKRAGYEFFSQTHGIRFRLYGPEFSGPVVRFDMPGEEQPELLVFALEELRTLGWNDLRFFQAENSRWTLYGKHQTERVTCADDSLQYRMFASEWGATMTEAACRILSDLLATKEAAQGEGGKEL